MAQMVKRKASNLILRQSKSPSFHPKTVIRLPHTETESCILTKSTETLTRFGLTNLVTAVERILHTEDSQGQILAMAFIQSPHSLLGCTRFAWKWTGLLSAPNWTDLYYVLSMSTHEKSADWNEAEIHLLRI